MLPAFCSFPLLHDSFSLTIWEQENSPSQRGGGTDHGSMTSAQEGGRRWSSPSSYFSFDFKAVAHSILCMIFPCPPTCKPHKRPSLINHFLFFAVPCGMQDLSSPTRCQTRHPCRGRAEFLSLGHQGSPRKSLLIYHFASL